MTDDISAGSNLGAARPLASAAARLRDALTDGTHIGCRNSDLVIYIR